MAALESPRTHSQSRSQAVDREVPEAAVSRLPLYLKVLEKREGLISSEQLAELAGVNAARVRKDLSYLGTYGIRGVGYDVEQLRSELAEALGLNFDSSVILIGAGNLGQALLRYSGFATKGFRLVGVFDADPLKINTRIDSHTVQDMRVLETVIRQNGVSIAIMCVPGEVAQRVVERVVDANIKSILNFAPTVLSVPADVEVRQVDLAAELQILSYHRLHQPNKQQKVVNTSEPIDLRG